MSNVSDVGEKRLIQDFIRPLLASPKEIIQVGIGDDAAVIAFPAGSLLVVSTDKTPEKLIAHDLGLIGFEETGYYLVAAALSDLAAMGAAPLGILVCLSVPPEFSLTDFEALIGGIRRASKEFDTPILGGDTKGGSVVGLVSTAIGHIASGNALTRSAAKPGEAVCITGSPCRFGTALAYFLNLDRFGHFLNAEEEQSLISALRAPKPRIEAGQILQRSSLCGACQDVSDGVGQTAIELAAASHIGIELDLDAIMASAPPFALRIAQKLGCSPESILLGPGADFELMFTVRPDRFAELSEALLSASVPVHKVGSTVVNAEVRLTTKDGRVPIKSPGFEHLSNHTDISLVKSKHRPKPDGTIPSAS